MMPRFLGYMLRDKVVKSTAPVFKVLRRSWIKREARRQSEHRVISKLGQGADHCRPGEAF